MSLIMDFCCFSSYFQGTVTCKIIQNSNANFSLSTDSFVVSQTASCSWFLKTSPTKRRATRRGPVSPWRRSAVWTWDSGMKAWLSLWPSSAWTRPLCWASTARRPCRRGTPACDTASEKVRRSCRCLGRYVLFFLLFAQKLSRIVNYFKFKWITSLLL